MQNFLRALGKVKPYWLSLATAAVCSFVVAALWGANIGAFYPILEVTIRGQSTHQWIDEELAEAQRKVSRDSRSIVIEEGGLRSAPEATDETRDPLEAMESQRLSDELKLATLERAEGWIKAYLPSDPFQTILLVVGVLMASTLVKHLFLIVNDILVGRVSLDIARSIRQEVFEKALGMDRAAYANFGDSGVTARITHTTLTLSRGLMNTLGAAIREPLKVLACLVGAAIICWPLLLLSVVIGPLVGWLLYLVTTRLRAVSQHELKKAEAYHAVMLESLNNVGTVQSFRMEHLEQGRFADATLSMRNYGLKFIFYSSLAKPIIEFLGLGMLGVTILSGSYLVLNQETSILGIPICREPMSVSALLVFFGMLIGMSDPLRKLAGVYASVYAGCMAADRIYSLLDQPANVLEPESPREPATPHRVLRLDNVRFGYDKKSNVLAGVSLDIPFGSTIAIVGQNGAGKSTLLHLLSRFYDPVSGAIRFDDVDFREMRIADVRERIALVNQHTELFNNTVAYNIRYGRMDATDEEVQLAAQQAHAHDFITHVLSDGYETVVGANGTKLSGGQRQRIALARALLCDPEILILDEGTSHIDMKSEQMIRESLRKHRGERTMIIITHREKLLDLADAVYEVVDGHLVERSRPQSRAA